VERVNIKEAGNLTVNLLNLAIDEGKYVAVRFSSGPGLGKTSMVRQSAERVAKQRGVKVTAKVVRLSEVEQPDVKGYGFLPKGNDNTAASAKMQFSLPFWAWDREVDGDYGILFLDEFSQCADDLQKVAAQILLERSVGDYVLPPGVIVVAAGNRESDRSGVRKTMAFIQNRLMDIQISISKDALVEWMEKNGISPHIVSFVEAHPGDVLQEKVPDKPGPFCTPRSLVMLDPLIGKMTMEQFTECAAGLIGEGTGGKFVAHLRVIEDLPKYSEIVANPKGCKVPERPDANYAVMQIIAHNVDGATAKQAFEYLKRMGKEFQAATLRTSLRRCPQIVQHPDFAVWLRENRQLLEAANLIDSRSR
jgi:hypothetical protein